MRKCYNASKEDMRKFGVYKIELNGEIYIGSTVRPFYYRWSNHYNSLLKGSHDNKHLQRAYNLYGELTLSFSIIEINTIPEMVLETEQKYIDKSKPKYNMCPVTGSCLGKKLSDEHKLKISNSGKGRIFSLEHRQRMSEALKGNKNCLGKKNALGYKLTKEQRQKQINAMLGHRQSEKQKFIASTRIRTAEERIKISQAKMGHTVSGETRNILRQKAKEWWANERIRREQEIIIGRSDAI